MKFRLLLLPVLLPALLGACSQPPTATEPAAPVPGSAATAHTEAAMLERYHWQLSDANDADGARIDALFVRADRPVQLDFADQRLSVGNTCNRMGGQYEISDGRLQVGRMAQTRMACADPALAALDDAVGKRLQGNLQLDMEPASDPAGDAPRLSLTTTAGDVLVFTGQPTAQMRYGSQGETVFLEVAAKTVPCQHPLIPDKQCLQVRERHYDQAGLATGKPGDWQPLYQDIEGYTHQPGVRNVLRLKRFAIANPPADGLSVAYVLDMVVESDQSNP